MISDSLDDFEKSKQGGYKSIYKTYNSFYQCAKIEYHPIQQNKLANKVRNSQDLQLILSVNMGQFNIGRIKILDVHACAANYVCLLLSV